jgi:hypothetical protein
MRRSSVRDVLMAYPQDEQNRAVAGIWDAQEGQNITLSVGQIIEAEAFQSVRSGLVQDERHGKVCCALRSGLIQLGA